MTAADRAARTGQADELCARAFEAAGCPEVGVALVAVGGYGRRELAPYSDLDVVLVLDPGVPPGEWAAAVWYPLWDSGATVDHSVRSLTEVAEQASADLRVALGMLDARHLAGDPKLTLRLRTTLLAQWRRDARGRLPELQALASGRASRLGELAHSSVPDLKESHGGLRDATMLKALVATWLVDVPHVDLERSRAALLDVRDALHEVAGRATDRVAPEYWTDLAGQIGLADATAAQRHTRGIGRRITHLSRLTWRRAEAVVRQPVAHRPRRPSLEPIGHGLAVSRGEVVLDTGIRPASDALLLLRVAAEAAERDLVLPPTTSARLVAECPPLPDPWPGAARDLMVRLLAAGPSLLPVWETLDETDAVTRFLPEWEQVRLLPHASAIHRFTVDRHLVETCIEAAKLIRRVARPDVLMVAALLHDIGKGRLTEHCVAGEPVAREVATRIGFDPREVDLVGHLVRWHLLLPELATTRDPDDPATVRAVTSRVPDREELELLLALSEADARATSEQAWTSWRSSLVRTLVARTSAALSREAPVPPPEDPQVRVPAAVREQPGRVSVQVQPGVDGCEVTVVSGDRVGLLADIAAMFALQRISVRAARAWTLDDLAVSRWQVAEGDLDEAVLLQRLENIVAGRVTVPARARGRTTSLEPTVTVRPEASSSSTVIEVRTADEPGVIHSVCRALAGLDVAVRSMHVTTLGPQGVDVFYVQESAAGALSDVRAADVAHAVRAALLGTVTLEDPADNHHED